MFILRCSVLPDMLFRKSFIASIQKISFVNPDRYVEWLSTVDRWYLAQIDTQGPGGKWFVKKPGVQNLLSYSL